MRKYTNFEENQLLEVCCNKCGKALRVENGLLKEGCFHGEHSFGYFSKRDGMKHIWDMCESCYEELLQGFALPVEECEENELL